ncbi:MAG TPA: ADOP family duplicated permease [Thermoanaerobaculia bacterium]|nr:ADOP family duplicated permease [Thermoanaerobaculia bacterium]
MTRHLAIAFRTLARRPGFALPVVVILALGIGATTGVFRLVGTLLLSPPPVADPAGLAWVVRPDLDDTFSRPEGIDYAERSGAFSGVAQYQSWGADLGRGATMQRVGLEIVSGDYFQVLGVPASHGRTLLPEDDPAGGGGGTAVLSTALAGRLFGGAEAALGREVVVNRQPFTVVGVAPPSFRGLSYDSQVDLWLPLAATTTVATFFEDHADAMERGTRWLRTVGRLAPGVGLDTAQQRIDAVVRWQAEEHPQSHNADDRRLLHSVAAGHPVVERDALPRLALVFATALVILLVAGANAANLLLARAVSRRHELGVRRALGAARRDLVRQLFVEGALLCAAGGAAGLLLSAWLVPLLAPVLPPGVDVEAFREPDVLIGFFAVGATLGSALLFALLPALRSTGERALGSLDRAARGASAGRQRGQGALVVVQVALSALLLVTTALLVRTVDASYRVDLGMETGGVAVATLSPGRLGYDDARAEALYRDLEERLAGHPAVESVALLTPPPLASSWMRTTIRPEGYTPAEDEDMNVHLTVAGDAFFDTLGIQRLAGRSWTAGPAAAGEAVINRALARRFFGDEQAALGRRIDAGPERDFRVVGVVADSHYLSPQLEPQPRIYQRIAGDGRYRSTLSMAVRGEGAGGGGRGDEAAAGVALEAISSTLAQLDPELVPRSAETLAASLDRVMAPQRSLALLLAAFAGLTLVVSAVGLYGVLTFAVRRRLREIGIRMALGAAGSRIVAGVVARGLALVALGIGVGLVLAALAGRFVEGHLFGVTATDPASYAAVAAVLVAVALVACAAPAGRAVAVDPARVLRSE